MRKEGQSAYLGIMIGSTIGALVVAAVVAFQGLAWLSYLVDGWVYLVFYGALAFLLIVFTNYSAFGLRRWLPAGSWCWSCWGWDGLVCDGGK